MIHRWWLIIVAFAIWSYVRIDSCFEDESGWVLILISLFWLWDALFGREIERRSWRQSANDY